MYVCRYIYIYITQINTYGEISWIHLPETKVSADALLSPVAGIP